jgi:hypothetical protein
MLLLEENLEELLISSAECQVKNYEVNCPRAVEYRVFWKPECRCASDSALICSVHEAVIRNYTWQCRECGGKIIILGTIKI